MEKHLRRRDGLWRQDTNQRRQLEIVGDLSSSVRCNSSSLAVSWTYRVQREQIAHFGLMATYLGLLFESTKDATLDPNTFNYRERKIISTISWLFTIYVEIVSFVNLLFMPLVREQDRKAGRHCNASRPVERLAFTFWINWTKFYREASKNVNSLNS